jgi:hypothetical protein
MKKTIATFATRKEALQIIESLDSRAYYLAHGEYGRPTYTARKARGKDKYYIHARYYFCAGTFYAKEDGGLDISSNELYNR